MAFRFSLGKGQRERAWGRGRGRAGWHSWCSSAIKRNGSADPANPVPVPSWGGVTKDRSREHWTVAPGSQGLRLGRGGKRGPRPGGAVDAPETGSGTRRTARPPGVWGYRKWSLGGPWWPPRLGGTGGSCSEGGRAAVLRAFGRVSPFPSAPEEVRPRRAQGPGSLSGPRCGPARDHRGQRESRRPWRQRPRRAHRPSCVQLRDDTWSLATRCRGRPRPSESWQSESRRGRRSRDAGATAGGGLHLSRRVQSVGGCAAVSRGLRDGGPGLTWPVPRAPGRGSRRGEGRTREERRGAEQSPAEWTPGPCICSRLQLSPHEALSLSSAMRRKGPGLHCGLALRVSALCLHLQPSQGIKGKGSEEAA